MKRRKRLPEWTASTLCLALCLAFAAVGCGSDVGPEEGSPEQIIAEAIDRYGGVQFQSVRISFEFRGTPFEVVRDDGRFRYQRTVTDSLGVSVTEVMENEGTWIEIGDSRSDLDAARIYDLETAVNSVVYFGFLPFRLDDDAVQLRHLGSATVAGLPYHKIEVTFRQEGGGVDWDARFVHWIHRDEATLDYLAYRYSRDGGGSRFRRAVNRREVGGLLVQDYENYAADPEPSDIAEYDRLYEEEALRLLSMVELEGVEVGMIVR